MLFRSSKYLDVRVTFDGDLDRFALAFLFFLSASSETAVSHLRTYASHSPSVSGSSHLNRFPTRAAPCLSPTRTLCAAVTYRRDVHARAVFPAGNLYECGYCRLELCNTAIRTG